MELLCADEISNAIRPEYRSYFSVSVAQWDKSAMPIARAFCRAAELICPAATKLEMVRVIFAGSPFRIALANGELTFTTKEAVVNVVVENIVFIDLNKMKTIPEPEWVLYILEELVHTIFRIGDESLAKKVTAHLGNPSAGK
jgi:hypothetical protein